MKNPQVKASPAKVSVWIRDTKLMIEMLKERLHDYENFLKKIKRELKKS